MNISQIMDIVQHPQEKLENSHDSAPSKEEEERYQKLLHENEEMQRMITEVNITPTNKFLLV